jgi:hypothetical protein
MQVGAGYSPKLIEGMDHSRVRSELENPGSEVGRAIREEIDNITALVCKSIGGKSPVCKKEKIAGLAAKI